MISDLVKFANNGNSFDGKWAFSPELTEGGIELSDLKTRILDRVTDADEHPTSVENVQKALGFFDNDGVLDTVKWDAFTLAFSRSIDDFIEIKSFPNITSALE